MNKNGNNVTSKKRGLTAKKIIAALKEDRGLLTMAARRAGVSYRTVNRYANEFPSVRQAVYDAKESMLDVAENELYKKIKNGNIVATLFFLKTKGKIRGYVERQEFGSDPDNPVLMKVEIGKSSKGTPFKTKT